MRIDLYNTAASQIANEQSSQKIAAENAAKSSESSLSGSEDHTTLTSDSTSVGSLVSSALNSPEVRQSLVDSLKASVSSGQYDLNPDKIAASMVDDHV
jgi:negative regulator of flagellin synthesis FlgM